MFFHYKYGKINCTIDKTEYTECSELELTDYYNEWAKKYKSTSLNIKQSSSEEDNHFMTGLVECYCGYDYEQHNNYLRFGMDVDNNTWREKTHMLWRIIFDAPTLPKNSVIYRSVCKETIKDILLKNKTGSVAQEKGFMSTSIQKKVVAEFKEDNYVLKLYIRKGTPALYVNCVCKRDESELLLPPNGFLKLISKPYFDKEISQDIYECYLFYY